MAPFCFISEAILQNNYLPFFHALHTYNGFWHGSFLCLTALFGIVTSFLYPCLCPTITPLTESIRTSRLELLFRLQIRSYGVLHALLATCFLVAGTGTACIVFSVNAYPLFPSSMPNNTHGFQGEPKLFFFSNFYPLKSLKKTIRMLHKEKIDNLKFKNETKIKILNVLRQTYSYP